MPARVRYFVPALLILSLLQAACEGNGDSANPAAATSIRSASSARITTEPSLVTPTLLSSNFCTVDPPFLAEVSVIVRGAEGLVVRGVAFDFFDASGARATPTVRPGSNTAGSVPTTPPLTLPTSSPVPIPRPGSGSGVIIPTAGLVTLPFSLEFGCGIPASGTLIIVVSTGDATGTVDTSEARVRIGR